MTMRQTLSDTKLEAWYTNAMKTNSYFQLFMKTCEDKGSVRLFRENINYFKQDILICMLENMRKEGITYSFSNVSHIFESFLEKRINVYVKKSLINCIRMQLLLKSKPAVSQNPD